MANKSDYSGDMDESIHEFSRMFATLCLREPDIVKLCTSLVTSDVPM